jgi:hypothetical protein
MVVRAGAHTYLERPAAGGCRRVAVALCLGTVLAAPPPARAQELIIEGEVMEGSPAIEVPGFASGQIRYAIVHHKHQKDQASFASWLRRSSGAQIAFETLDGTAHRALIRRLDHCFGRGLLLYSDPVELRAKGVILLRLGQAD